MKLKFYGTRGSTPVFGNEFQEFGGNTTCIKLSVGENNKTVIFDAGTGIRGLGKDLVKEDDNQKDFLILFSHFHWDHIQGLPFFPQAYNKENAIKMLAMGKNGNENDLRKIFTTQLQSQYFPVQLENMGAKFEFIVFENATKISGLANISVIKHSHPGSAYSYRIENHDKSLVICTDIEHRNGIDDKIVEFAKNADILVHDAQYTSDELSSKIGWGHSSYDQALEVAKRANVKKLILTHHDPDHEDDFLLQTEKHCQSIFSNCILAREKAEIQL